MQDEFLIYIAGFFDGEGTVRITNTGMHILFSNTNKEILEKIRNFFKVGSIRKQKMRSENHNQVYRLTICGTQAGYVLEKLLP